MMFRYSWFSEPQSPETELFTITQYGRISPLKLKQLPTIENFLQIQLFLQEVVLKIKLHVDYFKVISENR